MSTLNYFSEDEKARAIYDARWDAMLKEKMEQRDLEMLIRERDAATQERDAVAQQRDAVTQQRDAATQERDVLAQKMDALLAKFKKAGIDPDKL